MKRRTQNKQINTHTTNIELETTNETTTTQTHGKHTQQMNT